MITRQTQYRCQNLGEITVVNILDTPAIFPLDNLTLFNKCYIKVHCCVRRKWTHWVLCNYHKRLQCCVWLYHVGDVLSIVTWFYRNHPVCPQVPWPLSHFLSDRNRIIHQHPMQWAIHPFFDMGLAQQWWGIRKNLWTLSRHLWRSNSFQGNVVPWNSQGVKEEWQICQCHHLHAQPALLKCKSMQYMNSAITILLSMKLMIFETLELRVL